MTRAEKAVLHCDPYFFACVGGYPTRLASELAAVGMELFRRSWKWQRQVRSIGIRACELMSDSECVQLSFEYDYKKAMKLERLETSVDGIRAKYGKRSVTRDSLMNCGAAASRGIGFSGE